MAAHVVELTEGTFGAAIASGVTLVDFWAPWCGPCKMQGPIVDAVAPKFEGRATLAKVDVDQARDVAVRYNIRSIPALLIFKDGNVVETLVGLQRADAIEAAINRALV